MRVYKIFYICVLMLGLISPAFADLDDDRDLGKSSAPAPEVPASIPAPSAKDQSSSDNNPQSKKDKPAGSKKKPSTKNDKTEKSQPLKQQHPVTWSAKGLRGSRSQKIVDLLDDVVVTQTDLKLNANQARIYFSANDEVSKVEASGNVKVTRNATAEIEKMSARGNEAIFDNAKQTITLIGRAALWRGKDVVRGKRITYNLETGWINVDSVEGVVQPGEGRAEDVKPGAK